MLALEDSLKPFVPDYRLNLVDVGHPGITHQFHTRELQELFRILPAIYTGSAKKEKAIISGSIVSLAGILSGSKKMYEMGKKGDMPMCRALDAIEQHGIALGEQHIILLVQRLLEENRQMDLQRALNDPDYRHQISKEFGIS
jgi:hypothetical protein